METAERRLILSDIVLSFFWICAGAVPRIVLHGFPGNRILQEYLGFVLKSSWYFLQSFVFSWLGLVTRGGAYNPLNVLSATADGSVYMFPSTVLWRILAQAIGSAIGAELTSELFPKIRGELCANTDVHRGALTEGIMALGYTICQLGTKNKYPTKFILRTSVMSSCKLMIRILAGGCMNPASAFGWAMSRGDHATREHLFIYWFAPLEAALVGFWIFSLLVEETLIFEKEKRKRKSH